MRSAYPSSGATVVGSRVAGAIGSGEDAGNGAGEIAASVCATVTVPNDHLGVSRLLAATAPAIFVLRRCACLRSPLRFTTTVTTGAGQVVPRRRKI